MKLITCYIENFGCLHQLTVQFSDGLTVIQAPNGFGKTTLAEFIRAMFYGFPRSARDLQKNPRQKYAPWQGGAYGGWLVFSHQGKRYRIERSFGTSPRQDRFKLLDEDSRRESSDYSENIGTELFGIDGESFLRSTYMPQSAEELPRSTDSLRAKLGNLLEDNSDLTAYEKSLSRLKERRSKFENYKDGKGSITRTGEQISRLQTEIHRIEALQCGARQTREELAGLVQSRDTKAKTLQEVREQMTLVVQLQADAALQEQYRGLLNRQQSHTEALKAFTAQYPQGLPTEEELTALSALSDRAATLAPAMETTDADREAEAIVAQYAPHFSARQPSEEDMAARQDAYERYVGLQAKLDAIGLNEGEQQLLTALDRLFAPGIPDDDWFAARRSEIRELQQLQASAQGHTLPDTEKEQLQKLQGFFRRGLPDEATLDYHQEQLELGHGLIAALPEALPDTSRQPKRFHVGFLPALIPALLCACAGLFLLVLGIAQPALVVPDEQYAPLLNMLMTLGLPVGMGCMAVAGLLGILAGVLQSKQRSRNREIAAARETVELAERHRQQAEDIRREAIAFVASYPVSNTENLSRALSEIRSNGRLYRSLLSRSEALSLSALELRNRQNALTLSLQGQLRPYTPAGQDHEQTLRNLQERKQRYLQLLQAKKSADARRMHYTTESTQLAEDLQSFLRPYFGAVAPHQFAKALSKLQTILDTYTAAQKRVQLRKQQLDALQRELTALSDRSAALLQPYGMTLAPDSRTQLQGLYNARQTLQHLQQAQQQAQQETDAFRSSHGAHLSTVIPADLTNPEHLKIQERTLTQNLVALTDMIAKRTQQLTEQQQELDTLPLLTDELQRQISSKAEDTANRQTLDHTIAFLQQARESLSSTYMNNVETRFARYLEKLTGELPATVRMNSDLQVQLERSGERRDLGYFSAGQQDMVDLCMRLALADALFEGEPCFMILDDPFVNLDDAHTRAALELLKELAADRQFIYLVCHSSRAVRKESDDV